jgi:hypothetical protein
MLEVADTLVLIKDSDGPGAINGTGGAFVHNVEKCGVC